jgi:hypothetical protein
MIKYIFKRSCQARNLRITVHRDMRVVVTMPFFFSVSKAEKFVRDKSDWIKKSLEKIGKIKKNIIPIPQKGAYRKYKEEARVFLNHRLDEVNRNYSFRFFKVSIRNQKTRWGSCSRNGNLNFNYKILFLPLPLAEYIITHELCHLKEMNHSLRFWNLVAKTVPEHKKLRKQLRQLAVI